VNLNRPHNRNATTTTTSPKVQPVASCSDLPRGLSTVGGPVDVFTVDMMGDEGLNTD
jgi:hypothetical protein